MTSLTQHRYIVQDNEILGGVPIIEETRTSVRAVVELWHQGIAPEDIPNRLPHLTLAQVFDALSYNSDHQQEIARYIEANHVSEAMLDPLVCGL